MAEDIDAIPTQRARVVVEVADAGERQPIDSPAGVYATWLHRDGTPPGKSTALVDTVTAMAPPAGSPYVWGGGESRAMTAIRTHARRTWGLPRERVSLTPYWRHPDSPVPTEDDE
jgi:NADPH-dependent ferric siderophore reductase